MVFVNLPVIICPFIRNALVFKLIPGIYSNNNTARYIYNLIVSNRFILYVIFVTLGSVKENFKGFTTKQSDNAFLNLYLLVIKFIELMLVFKVDGMPTYILLSSNLKYCS